MATNVGDFFIGSNSVYNITDEDYQKINLLINSAKAFARSTHQCVYIIDYFKQNFLYVSENLDTGADRHPTKSRISGIIFI